MKITDVPSADLGLYAFRGWTIGQSLACKPAHITIFYITCEHQRQNASFYLSLEVTKLDDKTPEMDS
jgi:hypothetical protein